MGLFGRINDAIKGADTVKAKQAIERAAQRAGESMAERARRGYREGRAQDGYGGDPGRVDRNR